MAQDVKKPEEIPGWIADRLILLERQVAEGAMLIQRLLHLIEDDANREMIRQWLKQITPSKKILR